MTTARKRGSLAELMPQPGEAPPMPAAPVRQAAGEAPAVAAAVASAGRKARAAGRTSEVRTSEVRTSEVPSPDLRTPGLPKYKRLDRKDVLLWPDQMGQLSVVRQLLNRRRGGAGERITENTLIRLGVALLLSRSADLSGTTEEELRRSLGL